MKNSDDQFIRFNADHTTVTDGQTELNCRGLYDVKSATYVK